MTQTDNGNQALDLTAEVQRLSTELKELTRRRMDIEDRTGDTAALAASLEKIRRDTAARTSPELVKERAAYDEALENLRTALADADWYRWVIHRVLTIALPAGILDRAKTHRGLTAMDRVLAEEAQIREELREATAGYPGVDVPPVGHHYTPEELNFHHGQG